MLQATQTIAGTSPSALPVSQTLRVEHARQEDFEAVARLFSSVRGYNASLDDRFALAEDWQEVLRDQFENTYADPAAALWLLAWNDHEPVGLLVIAAHLDSPLLKHRRWAEVMALYVAPQCRGTGLAQALMAQARLWAQAQGFERVQVHAVAANDHARSFYRRSGFVPVQEVLRLNV